jgi:hypothetical protein
VAYAGNDQGRDILEIGLQRFFHRWNRVLPANRWKTKGKLIPELFLVEFHIVDNLAAIVEARVHTPLPGKGRETGSYVARRDGSRLAHLVLEPSSDINVLFTFGLLGRQIGKHLEYKVPLPLVVRELNVV